MLIKSPTISSLLSDRLGVAVLVISLDDGKIRYCNPQVCDDIEKKLNEIQNQHYRFVFWPEFVPIYEELQTQCQDGKIHTITYHWLEKRVWDQISARHIILDEDQPAILLSITNITEAVQTRCEFEQLAYFDNILNLPNGLKLEEDTHELASTEMAALIYIEIERLDDINELYGWHIGDHMLMSVRDWLLASELQLSQLYRVNKGFAILAYQVSSEKVSKRAEEIIRRFQSPWIIPAANNSLSLFCKIELGIVYGKYIKNEIRNLLLRTSCAPKNPLGYSVYDDKTDEIVKQTLQLRETLINCILKGMIGFEVHYQPIAETKSQQWSGLEALCRWTTPDGQKAEPFQFIYMAEQLGLVGELDSWVRKTALRQCVALGLTNYDNFYLNVNFSSTQKINQKFIDDLMQMLNETKFPPEKLNLEITENSKVQFDEENLEGLRQLKEKGIILSVDDFGTGYSSIDNLIHLSVSVLKIDKNFLSDIEHDPYLLGILVDLSHHLDLKIIIEGVETEEQLRLLKSYHVDYIQGYLLSKPLPYDLLKEEIWHFK